MYPLGTCDKSTRLFFPPDDGRPTTFVLRYLSAVFSQTEVVSESLVNSALPRETRSYPHRKNQLSSTGLEQETYPYSVCETL